MKLIVSLKVKKVSIIQLMNVMRLFSYLRLFKRSFLDDKSAKNAGTKARNDVEEILLSLGYQPLVVSVDNWFEMNLLKAQSHKYSALKNTLVQLKAGDELIIQFPMLHHSLFISYLLKGLKKKGGKTYFLIHDLEMLRFTQSDQVLLRHRIRIQLQESNPFKSVDGIIAHNDVMKSILVDKGLSEDKIVSLEIFDYLIPNFSQPENLTKNDPFIVAGNLATTKAGYLYELPAKPDYNLYGVGFVEEKALPNEHYFGSFLPDDLPAAMKGSFGLVWDGDSAETCSGVFGNYLRFNNSHKTSLYLAAGYPVIVWKESTLSHFILEKGCGIAVDSLHDIAKVLEELSEEDYQALVLSAQEIGQKIRQGNYLTQALEKLNIICSK